MRTRRFFSGQLAASIPDLPSLCCIEVTLRDREGTLVLPEDPLSSNVGPPRIVRPTSCPHSLIAQKVGACMHFQAPRGNSRGVPPLGGHVAPHLGTLDA